MPPTLTGSILEIEDNTNNPAATSITVPSDADLAFVGVVGYQGSTANYFSGGTMTLGGNSMTALAADASTGAFMAAGFYLVAPPTGSQNLDWDWAEASAADNGAHLVYLFVKDAATASTIRDSEGLQTAADPMVSKTLTAVSGDLILAFAGSFNGGGNAATWTNATEQFDQEGGSSTAASVAIASPTGNQTVTCNWSGASEGGIVTLVIKADAGATEKVGSGIVGP